LIKKFPTVWEKNSENRRGDFFLTHTVHAYRAIGINNVSLVTRGPSMTTAEQAGPSFELPFSQIGSGTASRSSEKEPERRSGAFRLHWSSD